MNETAHPLAGWWLIRSYPPGCEPFASVMALSETEAEAHYKAVGIERGDSEHGYFKDRQAVEHWLAGQAATEGVRPETAHPLYFCLSPRPLQTSGAQQNLVAIAADRIPEHLISLTIDDSFYNYFAATRQNRPDYAFRHELHGTVLSAGQFRALVGGHDAVLAVPPDEPSLWNLGPNPHGGPRYVEAQIWTYRLEGI